MWMYNAGWQLSLFGACARLLECTVDHMYSEEGQSQNWSRTGSLDAAKVLKR